MNSLFGNMIRYFYSINLFKIYFNRNRCFFHIYDDVNNTSRQVSNFILSFHLGACGLNS